MHIPTHTTHLIQRDPSLKEDQTRTIAWVVTIIVAAVLIIGIWCAYKLWGSRERNSQAEQDLGVRSLPPPRPRTRRERPQEEFLPVYEPPVSPPGMPPPAYLPGDAMGRETYRRDGICRALGSIEEKEEPEEKKERRASV